MGLGRRHIGQNRYHPYTAQRHDGNNLIVIARIDIYLTASDSCKMGNLADVAAGLLDTYNIFHLAAEPQNRLRLDIAAGSAGHIIKQHGQIHRVRHCLEMRIQAVLGRLVVIRAHQQ